MTIILHFNKICFLPRLVPHSVTNAVVSSSASKVSASTWSATPDWSSFSAPTVRRSTPTWMDCDGIRRTAIPALSCRGWMNLLVNCNRRWLNKFVNKKYKIYREFWGLWCERKTAFQFEAKFYWKKNLWEFSKIQYRILHMTDKSA